MHVLAESAFELVERAVRFRLVGYHKTGIQHGERVDHESRFGGGEKLADFGARLDVLGKQAVGRVVRFAEVSVNSKLENASRLSSVLDPAKTLAVLGDSSAFLHD